ncbi:hypothetical protein D9M68_875820 [compost metagenome]
MLAGCLAAIQCLPKASVQFTEPFKTMSMILEKALADKRSVGEIKLPAALFNKASTLPNFASASANTFSTWA